MAETTLSDLTRVAFGVLNSSYVLPGTPPMLVARMSNENLVFTPDITESPELNPSGQPVDHVLLGGSSSGNIEFPIIRSLWFHSFMESVFRSTWGVGTLGYESSPGVWATRAVTADELIPAKTLRLYKAEKQYDTPTAASYHTYDRVAVGSLNIRVQPKEIVSGSFALVGGMMALDTAPIVGATYADPGTYVPFTAPEVQEIDIGSLAAEACMSSLTLNFNSNLRPIDCIGREDPKTRGLGRFQAMIEGTAYFVSNDILEELLSQAAFAITVAISDGSGNVYTFDYPKCKFVSAPVATPGSNNDVTVPVSIRALYSPNHKYSVRCVRTLAV